MCMKLNLYKYIIVFKILIIRLNYIIILWFDTAHKGRYHWFFIKN